MAGVTRTSSAREDMATLQAIKAGSPRSEYVAALNATLAKYGDERGFLAAYESDAQPAVPAPGAADLLAPGGGEFMRQEGGAVLGATASAGMPPLRQASFAPAPSPALGGVPAPLPAERLGVPSSAGVSRMPIEQAAFALPPVASRPMGAPALPGNGAAGPVPASIYRGRPDAAALVGGSAGGDSLVGSEGQDRIAPAGRSLIDLGAPPGGKSLVDFGAPQPSPVQGADGAAAGAPAGGRSLIDFSGVSPTPVQGSGSVPIGPRAPSDAPASGGLEALRKELDSSGMLTTRTAPTVRGTLEDIGGGLLEAPAQVLGGARDAIQELNESAFSLGEWLNENVADLGQVTIDGDGVRWEPGTGKATPGTLPQFVDGPETTTGGLVRGVVQFLAAYAPFAKALGVAGAATKAGALGRAAAAGAGADAFGFDPHDDRLSNLVEQFPDLSNPVTAYLAADPSDSEAEGRFKNALEGLGLGAAAEGLFRAVKAVRSSRRVRSAAGEAGDGAASPRARDFSAGDRVRLVDPGGPNDGATAEVLRTNDRSVMIRLEDGQEFGAGRDLLERVDTSPSGGEVGPLSGAESAGNDAPLPDGPAVAPAGPKPNLAGMSAERLGRLAQTGDDATREAVRAELRGRGVEVPDYSDLSDPVASAKAMADTPPTAAENVARGGKAFDAAAGGDLVRSAMYRQDLGPVAFDFGGLSDRIEKPTLYRGPVVEAVAKGKLTGKPESGKVTVTHNGVRLALNRRNVGGREIWAVDGVKVGEADISLRRADGPRSVDDQLPTRRVRTANGREMSWRGPVDILTWARSRGGLWDDAGELRTIGLENKARRWVPQERFVGPLVRGDVSERFNPAQSSLTGPGVAANGPGMTLDDATLAAWEAGYFGAREDRPTVQEFLDLLDRASRADSLDNAVLAEADRLELDALPSRVNVDGAAYRMGLDTGGLSDAEVSDRVFSEAGRSDGDAALPADFDRGGGPAGAAVSDQGRRVMDAVNAGGGEPVARAGNIRLDKLDTVEDIQAALKATADENAAFGGARRGVVSDKALSELADDLGTTATDLANRRVGDAMNAEELLAARRLLADSTEDLVQKARAARGGSDDALAEFQRAYTRHVAIQEAVSGATAEAGRALRQLRIQAASERQRARVVKELIETSGGRDRVEDLADKLASLNDPAAVNQLARQAYEGGALKRGAEAIYEYWINSLLSGPGTHITNITSNALTHLTTLPEEALGAAFGAARQAVGKGGDRIYAREAAERAFGLVEGVRDAFRASAKSLRTGEGFDAAYNKLGDGEREGAIPGFLGKVVRVPTRMLEVEDTFFKALAMRPELNALAIRQATKEGLKGDAWARRVAELKAKPTPDMVEDALQKARVLTFTNSLGETGRAFQHLRRVPGMKWVIPFLKTPTNILTYAARRSPFAPLVRSFREDMAKGGAARDRALAQVTLGTATALAAFSYAREGLITGGGPSDPKEKSALYATGWAPYSVRVGDAWYAYDRLDPLGLLVGVAADMSEVVDKADEKDASELAAGLVLAFAKTMKDKSYLRGISDTMSAIDDPDRYAGRWLRSFAGSFVPNIVGQYTRAADPVVREVRTFADEFKARLPGSSHTLFPRRDVWGEPITRAGGVAGEGTAARALSPVRVSRDPTDPVTQEVMRLDIIPSKASKTMMGVELTPAQYDDLQVLTGKLSRSMVEAIQRVPLYDELADAARRELTVRALRAARSKAREAFYSRWPEVQGLSREERTRALTEGRKREKVTQ